MLKIIHIKIAIAIVWIFLYTYNALFPTSTVNNIVPWGASAKPVSINGSAERRILSKCINYLKPIVSTLMHICIFFFLILYT